MRAIWNYLKSFSKVCLPVVPAMLFVLVLS